MRLGEAIFLGIVTGAALAVAWEIWGEVIRQHADNLPSATVPEGADGSDFAGDVEGWLRSEGY